MSVGRRAPRRLRAQGGQAIFEHLGVILVLAAVLGAVAAGGVGGKLTDALAAAACKVAGQACGQGQQPPLPGSGDTDGDGLTDDQERRQGTRPDRPDTDGDGLDDADEAKARTDPLASDTDGDSVPDGEESDAGADPLEADTDRDGLDDGEELAIGTPPGEADGDTDGYGGKTDGLTDKQEVETYGTDPAVIDTDGDGTSDGDEVKAGTDPLLDERTFGDKATPVIEDLLLGDLPTPAALGTALKKLPGIGKKLNKLLGAGDDAAKLLQKNLRNAQDRKRKLTQERNTRHPPDTNRPNTNTPRRPDRGNGTGAPPAPTPGSGAIHSLDDLSEAASAPAAGGQSAAGRALQKHGDRPGSIYPRISSPAERSRIGRDIVEDYLTDPSVAERVRRDGTRIFELPDGRGVSFNPDGSFRGLREPRR